MGHDSHTVVLSQGSAGQTQGGTIGEAAQWHDSSRLWRHKRAMPAAAHCDPRTCWSAGSVVVELGCGSAQKTSILLNELLARDGPEQVWPAMVQEGR